MIVGAVIIATYTILRGFLAASTTDFIQSIIMTFALVIVVFFMLYTVGGLNSAISQAEAAVNGYFNLNGADGSYGFLPIVSMMSWGLGYFGMPHILLRFMAIKDDRKLKLSRRIASVWVVIAMGVAVFIGVIGYAFTSTMDLMDIEGFDPERIVIYVASAISDIGPLTAVIGGLIIAGILAATMSTSDSQMLAAASSVSENIVRNFIARDMSNKMSMLIARITVLVIAAIGVIFAWNPNKIGRAHV